MGEQNPLTADCYEKLARIRTATGRYDDAQDLFRRALAIEERTVGPNDGCVAQCLEGYAQLLHKIGNETMAESMEQRIRTIRSSKAAALVNTH